MTLTFFVPRPDSDRARANTFTFGGLAAVYFTQVRMALVAGEVVADYPDDVPYRAC